MRGRAGLKWIKLGTPTVHWPRREHDYDEILRNPRHLLAAPAAYAREVARTRRACRTWSLLAVLCVVVTTALGVGILAVRGFDIAVVALLLVGPVAAVFLALHRQDLMLRLLRRGHCLGLMSEETTARQELRGLHRRLHRRQRRATVLLLIGALALGGTVAILIAASQDPDGPLIPLHASDHLWLLSLAIGGSLWATVMLLRRPRLRVPLITPRTQAPLSPPRPAPRPSPSPSRTHAMRDPLRQRRARSKGKRILVHRYLFCALLPCLIGIGLALLFSPNVTRAFGMVLGMFGIVLILTINSATIAFTRRARPVHDED